MTTTKRTIRIQQNTDHPHGIVTDAETGEPISGVRSVDLYLRPREAPRAVLTVFKPEVDLEVSDYRYLGLSRVPTEALRLELEARGEL